MSDTQTEETFIEKRHKENPYDKGKRVIIADLILDGLDNDEIRDRWVTDKYTESFGSDITRNDIYDARTRLKAMGLLDPITGRPKAEKKDAVVLSPVTLPETKVTEESHSVFNHPDWDKLSFAEIDAILDPTLKTRILDYRSDKRRAAAEAPLQLPHGDPRR